MKFRPLKNIIKSLTGREDVLRENLSVIYSGDRLGSAVKDYRVRLLKRYIAVGTVTAVLILAAMISSYLSDLTISKVTRPEAGSSGRVIPVTVQGKYKGHTVESSENLNISAIVLSEKQKKKKLSAFAELLPDKIAPMNSNDVRIIKDDISLPKKDTETGIEMRWESSDPAVLSEEGRLNVIPLQEENETITLSAVLTLESVSYQTSFDVVVGDFPDSYDTSVKNQIRTVVEQISETSEGGTVVLPDQSADGITLKWSRRDDSNAKLLLTAGLIMFFCLFAGRYEKAKKNAKQYRESVVADFPAVVDKLVLLLNSGLTVYSALMRISSDYEDEKLYGRSPAALEIAAIGQRVQNTNSSVIDEWKQFATRMESSDILRFCTILEDNMSKGSELSMKLENESDELRELRRKNVQQYIRMIDSRMMIPMMMMLLSLVLVTVAPVITGF